jgi:hypothetical protein
VKAVCMSGAALGALLVHLETLEARVAELSRPRHPEDYGVQTLRLSPTEERILMALLPPGEVVHREALIARVWPEVEAAGLVGESAHLLRVHMSRIRCSIRLRAARAQPSRVACPDCAAWMDGRSTRCYRCDLARRQHRQGAVA